MLALIFLIFTGTEVKLVKKMSWPSSSPSLETHLSKNNDLNSCWQQLNPAASTLPSTALNFLMEAILTAIRRPGILALTDSWVTVKTMTAPPLTFLKDRVLLLAGASETLGAELLQLLMQSALGLKQLIIAQGEGEMSKELHGVLRSTGFPIVLVESASQGTNFTSKKKNPFHLPEWNLVFSRRILYKGSQNPSIICKGPFHIVGVCL
jgi:hypothetical protein